MTDLLDPLEGKAKTIFTIVAVILIFNAISAAANGLGNMAWGATMKEIFQAAGYGLAFVGGLALFTTLNDDSNTLTIIGAGLLVLGTIGATILLVAYILSPLGIIANVPGWVNAMGAGIPLGQIGLLLYGTAALRSEAYDTPVGIALMGPIAAFIIFFVAAGIAGEGNAPAWAPVLVVSLQTIAHLAIAFIMPGDAPQTFNSRQAAAT